MNIPAVLPKAHFERVEKWFSWAYFGSLPSGLSQHLVPEAKDTDYSEGKEEYTKTDHEGAE